MALCSKHGLYSTFCRACDLDLLREESDAAEFCRHGNLYSECDECDAEIEQAGGIDKCLNCGRYKSGNQLNRDQVCKAGCTNPNEY